MELSRSPDQSIQEHTIDRAPPDDERITRSMASKALNAAGILIDPGDFRDPIEIARVFGLL